MKGVINVDIWKEWEEHYLKLGVKPDQICKDGIAVKDKFNSIDKRVLFVLRETNNWPGGDMRKGLLEPGGWVWMMGRWATGILKDFPAVESVENRDLLLESLKSVAIINLKKATGGVNADLSQINAFAYTDRTLLRKQIRDINPTVIVACGTYDTLVWLLETNASPQEIANGKFLWGTVPVVRMRHPSYAKIKETYEQLARYFK